MPGRRIKYEFNELGCVSCFGHQWIGGELLFHMMGAAMEMGLHEGNRGCIENFLADILESHVKHI